MLFGAKFQGRTRLLTAPKLKRKEREVEREEPSPKKCRGVRKKGVTRRGRGETTFAATPEGAF